MPKVVDHAERRQQIAEAACAVVAREGLEGATVREIARAAGCSTGVLAHYFADKPALLGLALTTAGERTAERMHRHHAIEPARDALRAVALEALPLDEQRREEWRVWLAFWGQAVADFELRELQRDRYERWRGQISSLLRRGVEDGSMHSGIDPDRESQLLVAQLDGLGIQAMFEPERFPPAEQVVLLDAAIERVSASLPAA